MIASVPNREAKRELMHQLANDEAEAQQQFFKWQEFVFNLFLKEILGDSEIVQALSQASNHQSISFDLAQIFKGYDKIASVSVGPAEIDTLYKFSDEDIRQKLTAMILGVDTGVLQREARKAHGPSEISDMDVPINVQGDRFYLCIPVKSAREITGKVPEEKSYQILRPFLNFDRCVVVFITARSCSQNLMNTIKRMRDKFGWSIEVIENKELAQLLKYNNLL